MTPEERLAGALEVISKYGYIDGAHHKQWVLDQVVRYITDCPVVNMTARDGHTYDALGESEEYLAWAGSDDEDYDDWDRGIAP